MRHWLRLQSPQTFNEKLQWLKLHDRNPVYTIMVDKYAVRDYVAEKIGGEYLIPLLGVWDDAADIDFAALPDQFVLKCNHNSGGGMCICTDKSQIDEAQVKSKLAAALRENYYLEGREWPYKNVPPKVICEQYMCDEHGNLNDYKIHCFNGEPKVVLVCQDRFQHTGLTEDFFTPAWEHMDMRRPNIPQSRAPISPPERLSDMLSLARALSQGIPFVRVDLYELAGRIYFGELTFFPAGGMGRFLPDQWDRTLGGWLTLPE